MKAFVDLTWRGQSRRLRHLALQALRLYDLEVDRVSWVSRWTNDVLRVRTRNGNVYALRLSAPGGGLPRYRSTEEEVELFLHPIHPQIEPFRGVVQKYPYNVTAMQKPEKT